MCACAFVLLSFKSLDLSSVVVMEETSHGALSRDASSSSSSFPHQEESESESDAPRDGLVSSRISSRSDGGDERGGDDGDDGNVDGTRDDVVILIYKPDDVCKFAGTGDVINLAKAFAQDNTLVNARDANRGASPLQWACLNGHNECIAAILELPDVDVSQTDNEGQTAVHWAVINVATPYPLIQLLQKAKGIKPNEMTDALGYTPFHVAAQYGNEAALALLVSHFVRMQLSQTEAQSLPWCEGDAKQRTPLHWAAFKGHANVATLLSRLGCPEQALDDGGLTALDWACARGASAVVMVLIHYHVGRHMRMLTRESYAADDIDSSNAGGMNVPMPPRPDSDDEATTPRPANGMHTFRHLLTRVGGEGMTPRQYIHRLMSFPQAAQAAKAMDGTLESASSSLAWRAWDTYEDGTARGETIRRAARLRNAAPWIPIEFARVACAALELIPWRILAAPAPRASSAAKTTWDRMVSAVAHRWYLVTRHPKVSNRCVLLPILLIVIVGHAIIPTLSAISNAKNGHVHVADDAHLALLFTSPRALAGMICVIVAGVAFAIHGAMRARSIASCTVRDALRRAEASDRLACVPGLNPLSAAEVRDECRLALRGSDRWRQAWIDSGGGDDSAKGDGDADNDNDNGEMALELSGKTEVARLGISLDDFGYHHPLLDVPVTKSNAREVMCVHAGLALVCLSSALLQLNSLVYVEPLTASGLGLRNAASSMHHHHSHHLHGDDVVPPPMSPFALPHSQPLAFVLTLLCMLCFACAFAIDYVSAVRRGVSVRQLAYRGGL